MLRTLELYWSSLTSWLVRRLDRRWRQDEVGSTLREASLRVGTALVAARRGRRDDLLVALDQLLFVVGVAERSSRLTEREAEQVRRAARVVRELLP